MMSPADRKDFPFSCHNLNWIELLQKFSYGVRRFYIKEDCISPYDDFKQILSKNNFYWAQDLQVASKRIPNNFFIDKDTSKYTSVVMSAQQF